MSGTALGLGLGLPFRLAGGFSPASLFSAGEQGAWYDPSDLTTLFQDSAGTTPVTAVEQAVGLVLDKSKGGRQALPITGWVKDSGDGVVTVNGGTITITGATTTTRVDILAPGWAVGNLGDITINSNTAAGAVYVGGGAPFTIINGSKTYQQVIASSTLLRIQIASGSATFDVTSRGYVPGNHAYQTTSASRPTLRARYNLLTYSENLNGTGWSTLFGGTGTAPTITSNYATAPDGTNTASRFVGTRGANNTTSDYSLSVSPNATATTGASYLGSVYIKSNTGSNQNVTVYVVTGAAVEQIVAVAGSTWTRVSPTALTATTTPCNIVIGTRGGSYGGDQSLDILAWGTQVTSTAVFPSNTYQRIADAATYDTGSAFPPYLFFDGVDDSLLTNSVDFSAGDKMTVWAGVTKSSDAGTGTVVQLSSSTSTNNGVFGLFAPFNTGASADYAWQSKGTTRITVNSGVLTGPATSVFAGIGDVSAPLATLRRNAVQAATSAGSQGTGNFGNFALLVGSGAGLLNGNIYSLIIRGAQSTAAQISSTESWVAAKTPLGTI